MGTMFIYAIYDKVAQNFGFLFEQPNDGSAIRSLRKQIKEDIGDYLLYRIGHFNHNTGEQLFYDRILVNWTGSSDDVEGGK